MKEKKRPEALKPPAPPSGEPSMFDAKPDPENKNVTVSSGPYCEVVPVAGMSVKEVRRRFADRFDIAPQSASVVNGNPTSEDSLLKENDMLMFVHHAGEKGVEVTIEGNWAIAKSPEGATKKLDVQTLIERVTPQMDTGPCILPNGVKAVLSRGQLTIWFWEKAPCIQQLSWIRADSPRPYGQGTKYRMVRIALPYLIIMSVFQIGPDGMPNVARTDECFFRNEPLKSLHDELCYPALLNCSKFTRDNDSPDGRQPLSWICTQYLKDTKDMDSPDAGKRFCASFEAVRYCLLETSFNLSSEHHEGNSWYGASKHIDPRIASVEAWERATKEDPLFALEVPWIKTHHSVKDVAERTFKRLNATDRSVKNAGDLYRYIAKG